MRLRAFMVFAAAAAAAAASSSAWAIGPSFDCLKISASREPLPGARLICSSDALSSTDLAYTQAYYALRQQIGPNGYQALKQEATEFEDKTIRDCGITDTGSLPAQRDTAIACMAAHYEHQRSLWVSRLTGAAAEEATRPLEQHVALQRALELVHLLPPNAIVDGVYGSGTRGAIVRWQNLRDSAPTGLLGNDDARALSEAAPSSATPPAPTARGGLESLRSLATRQASGQEPASSRKASSPTGDTETSTQAIQWFTIRIDRSSGRLWCQVDDPGPAELMRQSIEVGAMYRSQDVIDKSSGILVESTIWLHPDFAVTFYRQKDLCEKALSDQNTATTHQIDKYK